MKSTTSIFVFTFSIFFGFATSCRPKTNPNSQSLIKSTDESYSAKSEITASLKTCVQSTITSVVSDGVSVVEFPFRLARFYFWDLAVGTAGSFGYLGSWGKASEKRLINNADAQIASAWAITHIPSFFDIIAKQLGEKFTNKEPHEQSAIACGIIGHFVFVVLANQGVSALKNLSNAEQASGLAKATEVITKSGGYVSKIEATPLQKVVDVFKLLPKSLSSTYSKSENLIRILNISDEIGYTGNALGFRYLNYLSNSNKVVRSVYYVLTDSGFAKMSIKLNVTLAKSRGFKNITTTAVKLAKLHLSGATKNLTAEVSAAGDLILTFDRSEKSLKASNYLVEALQSFGD